MDSFQNSGLESSQSNIDANGNQSAAVNQTTEDNTYNSPNNTTKNNSTAATTMTTTTATASSTALTRNPKKRAASTSLTSEFLKMEQKKKFKAPNLSETNHPPLPPKRVRRKNGLPVQPVPRSAKPQGELLTADEKKV